MELPPVVELQPPVKIELDAVPESANVSHASASPEEAPQTVLTPPELTKEPTPPPEEKSAEKPPPPRETRERTPSETSALSEDLVTPSTLQTLLGELRSEMEE